MSIGTFREWLKENELNRSLDLSSVKTLKDVKDSKLGKETVKIEQVLKGGDARFYLSDGREMEVSPEDTHLYTYIKQILN